MRVLGIDPSTAKPLGFGLVNERLTVEDSGLCSMFGLQDILRELKPDLVVVEDQYMARNFSTSKKLAWCAGKIMGMCAIYKIPNCVMNVAHWKSLMKAQSGTHIQRCKQIFNMDLQDDVASAVLIATAYLTENQICDKM